MKLLLFYPPQENLIDTYMPKILEKGVGFSPPLGLLYIANSVRQHTQWEVEVIDCVAERLTYAQIRQRISKAHPDAAGVTVMTHQLIDCLEIAKITKQIDPKIKVIFGGPHVQIYPKETVSFETVDYALTGEAELSIIEFLNSWGNMNKLSTIPGLYFKDTGSIMAGPPSEFIADLDKLAHPLRQLSKYKLYFSPLTQKKLVSTMITSRGCPFKCIFCDRPNLGKVFRKRGAEDVVDEMQECVELGIKHIKIYDDTFTVDKERVLAICSEIRRRKLNISWDIRAHINTIALEMLKALKLSGCKLICYGVESGNDEILKKLQKGIIKERVAEIFRLTRKIGILTLAYFMFGAPGETEQQMLETIDFAKKLNPDYCHFSILVPFPGTPIYEEGLREGMFSRDYWQEFARHPTLDFKPELWIENVPYEQMNLLLLRAYKEFYLRPAYMAKKLFQIRSLEEFKRKLYSGLYLFGNN